MTSPAACFDLRGVRNGCGRAVPIGPRSSYGLSRPRVPSYSRACTCALADPSACATTAVSSARPAASSGTRALYLYSAPTRTATVWAARALAKRSLHEDAATQLQRPRSLRLFAVAGASPSGLLPLSRALVCPPLSRLLGRSTRAVSRGPVSPLDAEGDRHSLPAAFPRRLRRRGARADWVVTKTMLFFSFWRTSSGVLSLYLYIGFLVEGPPLSLLLPLFGHIGRRGVASSEGLHTISQLYLHTLGVHSCNRERRSVSGLVGRQRSLLSC